MEQTAIVKRILPSGEAEVSLLRQMECGLSCKSCDGCPQKPKDELLALADNPIDAVAGSVVTVRPSACTTAWAAGLMFLLPCVGLVAGYLLGDWFRLSQGFCILASFLGLGVGFVPALLVNRVFSKRNRPEFTITSLRR